MSEQQEQVVEVMSFAALAEAMKDDAPAAVEPAEEVEQEEVEEVEQEEQAEEEQAPVDEAPKKKTSMLDELREERKEKREERQLRLAAEERANRLEQQNREILEALKGGAAAQEPEDEAIDAEHINPIKAELQQMKVTNALREIHDSGVEAFGSDYNVARQILLAAEMKAIKDEIEPAGFGATDTEIKNLASQRVRQRELNLLQSNKNVAEYTWKRANSIAAQFKVNDSPKKPSGKVDMAAITKARQESEIAPVKRQASGGNQAGSMADYEAMFAAEDKMRGGLS
jgi:hypothetical protein